MHDGRRQSTFDESVSNVLREARTAELGKDLSVSRQLDCGTREPGKHVGCFTVRAAKAL
jgi:hypothetical protein